MPVEIVPVKGLGKFLAFCRLPRQVYKGLPGFSAPLDAERWTAISRPKLNPHLQARRVAGLAGTAEGRRTMSGASSRIGLQERHRTPVGAAPTQFGAIEAIDDAAVVDPR